MVLAFVSLTILALAPAIASAAPSATTNPATKVHHTSAVLNGHLDPDADPGIIACAFEWGTTLAYGDTVPCNEGIVFASPVDVTANLSNLTPGTTYHFRLHVETTSSGAFNGADQSFRPDTFPITHPEIGSFGSDGTSASVFGDVYTVAFNQSTRELFALDRKASAIFGFDASNPPTYAPLAAFDPLSVPGPPVDQPDIAVDGTAQPSAGNVYYVPEKNFAPPTDQPEYRIFGYSAGGSLLPGFPITLSNESLDTRGCGVAVDSAGHLWVANHQNTIEEFSAAGVKLGSISVGAQGQVCKVAFDSNDDMYVTSQNGVVRRYTASSGYTSSVEFAPRSNNNVAIDTSTQNVFIGHFAEPQEGKYPKGGRVYEYDSAGNFLGEFAVGIEGAHVAVDAVDHHVFVASNDGKIHVFDAGQSTTLRLATATTGNVSGVTGRTATLNGAVDPEGFPVTDCYIAWGKFETYGNKAPCSPTPGSGSGDEAISAELTGLEPGTTYHFRVFASNADGTNAGKDAAFTTKPVPVLSIAPAANVTEDAADLSGTVNPGGVPASYRFEWGPTAAYGNSMPVPDGDAGSGEAEVPVSAHLSGLEPNMRYHWRLVAENVNGSAVTANSTFITLGAPIVETIGSPTRTTDSIDLAGRVAPRGFATGYFFEYGGEGPCDANPCTQTASQAAGSGALTQLVSATVGELEPNTTYHYRLVADNGQPGSPIFGEDKTVTTRASEAPLSHGRFPGPPGSDRAWEQVSPPDTGGNPVAETLAFSADGNRAIYSIAGGTPLSESGNLFSILYAERTPTGWEPSLILPPRNEASGPPRWKIYPDAEITTGIGGNLNETTLEAEVWRLAPHGAPSELYEGAANTYRLGEIGISEDGSRVLAALGGPQDPEHPAPPVNPAFPGENVSLYDLTSGSPKLVSLLPDGSLPACGVWANTEVAPFPIWKGTIRPDGSQVFFQSQGDNCSGPSNVYVRDLVANQTRLLTPPSLSGAECNSIFLSAAPGAAFFWTRNRLVAEDTPAQSCAGAPRIGGDVYRYDLDDDTFECVTCVVPGVDADVYAELDWKAQGALSHVLVAEDGSRVYFQSPHALVPGAPTVDDRGSTYRVNVDTGDLAWVGGPDLKLGRTDGAAATSDGTTLFFRSNASFLNPLNGSDNGGTMQYYRYDDRDRSLICISCPRDGSAALRDVDPMPTGGEAQGLTPISDDGSTIVFATTAPLVSADQNTPPLDRNPVSGTDVYEWRDGRYLLVTDGLTNTTPGARAPEARAISSDGSDLYFIVAAQLTPDALDGYSRLYDARIGGGFEYPKPPAPCPLEVCQGIPKGVPEEAAPGTGSFSGPGNVSKATAAKKCAKSKTRRKGRCVTKKTKKKSRAHKRANHNRRTAR